MESNDPAVRDLQEALKALGHDPGTVDGVFGAQTESAVKAFQQAREIPVDGVVGL
jgi:peptidoglycan hydrolase-like protein with peptidoglycan-binding domain